MTAGSMTRRSAAALVLGLMLLASPPGFAKGMDGGAQGDGVADDTAALQSVLDQGSVLELSPGRTYRITQTLVIKAPNSGIRGNGATLLMDSAPGAFDNGDPESKYSANAVGILAKGVSNIRLEDMRITYKGGIDDRYVKAIALRGVTGFMISGNEIWNFTKADGIVYVGASQKGEIRNNIIRDSKTNSRTNGQISGIVFDDDDKGSSAVTVAGNIIQHLTVGPDFKKAFFYQTDGINVTNRSSDITIKENRITDVGEGVDSFGTRIRIVRNEIRDAGAWGIKLIHGASDSVVRGNLIQNAGIGGIVLSNSKTVKHDTSGNVIAGNTITGVNTRHSNDSMTSFGIGLTGHPENGTRVMNTRITKNRIDARGGALYGIFADTGIGSGNVAEDNTVTGFTKAKHRIDANALAVSGE